MTRDGRGPASRQPVLTCWPPNAAAARSTWPRSPARSTPSSPSTPSRRTAACRSRWAAPTAIPAAWTSADGGSSWTRALGVTPAVFGRPGVQQLTSVTHGVAGWLAVGGVTAGAAPHPVVVVLGRRRPLASRRHRGRRSPAAACPPSRPRPVPAATSSSATRTPRPGRPAGPTAVAAAWWSAGPDRLAARPGTPAPGALDGTSTSKQMLAVTAGGRGFRRGRLGRRPARRPGPHRTAGPGPRPTCRCPIGATRTVLQHVASRGRTVVAVGTALTTTGQQVPFAASSTDGGATWTESALPMPAGRGRGHRAGRGRRRLHRRRDVRRHAGHQDVVVWTSANGTTWKTATPAGPGLTGPGIQAITGLTPAGQHAHRRRLQRLAGQRGTGLLAVPDPLSPYAPLLLAPAT